MAVSRVNGRFAPGVSGNPNGRPRRDAADPSPSAITRATTRTVTRHDGYVNPATGHGTRRDRRLLTRYRPDIVTDDQALNLWRSEFLAAKIIEALPEEAFKRGWSLKLEDKEVAEQVCAQAEDLGLEEILVEAAQYERAYGGAAIFPALDGAQGDLSRPLRPDAIASVKAFHLFEPRELTPLDYYNDLNSKEHGKPSLYQLIPLSTGRSVGIGWQAIHASRLIIFPGIRVSKQVQLGQREGWGDSVLCRPQQVLADYGLAWGSAATLLHEHGLGTLEMDGYAELMATAEGEEIVRNRVATMMMLKSALRALVIDGKDKYTQHATSLAGVADTLNEFKVLMAAAADMPVSVLTGQSQSGLRTGDDDIQNWHATVEKRRSKRYKPRHEQAVRFLMLAADGPTGGVEPDVWSVEYPPMRSPSEKEAAETRKVHMETAEIAINTGVASPDDVAESFFKGDTYSGDIKIDWERREAQAAIDAVAAEEMGDEDLAAMGYGEEFDDTELDAMADEDAEEIEWETAEAAA